MNRYDMTAKPPLEESEEDIHEKRERGSALQNSSLPIYTRQQCASKMRKIAVLRPLRIANSVSPVGLLALVHPTTAPSRLSAMTYCGFVPITAAGAAPA